MSAGAVPAQGEAGLRATALVVALLAVDGLHFVFARALHDVLPPITSVLFVIGIAALEVAGYALATGRFRVRTFLGRAPFFLAIGALIASSTTINYIAVGYVDPGTASLLAQMGVVWGLAFGLIWLKEHLTRRQLAGAALCMLGVVIITFQPGDYFRLGSLLIVGSTFAYALHAALVKRHGGGIDFVEFFLWRLVSTVGFVLLFAGAQGALRWPSAEAWPLLIAAGTIDVVISRSLYYLSMRRLKLSLLTLVLTLTPVVTILWSMLLFQVAPTPQQIVGGVAVLAGVLIVTLRRVPLN